MQQIGQRIETPEGVFFELDYSGEGMIFKDEEAFLNHPDAICYIPEAEAIDYNGWRIPETASVGYTHNDLLLLCEGDEELCHELFYELEWTCPTTLLCEWGSINEPD